MSGALFAAAMLVGTPATRANGPHEVDTLTAAACGALIAEDLALGSAAESQWNGMTPRQRSSYGRRHRRLQGARAKRNWSELTIEEQGEFGRSHPALRLKLIARWEAKSPSQRTTFRAKHASAPRRARKRRRTAS